MTIERSKISMSPMLTKSRQARFCVSQMFVGAQHDTHNRTEKPDNKWRQRTPTWTSFPQVDDALAKPSLHCNSHCPWSANVVMSCGLLISTTKYKLMLCSGKSLCWPWCWLSRTKKTLSWPHLVHILGTHDILFLILQVSFLQQNSTHKPPADVSPSLQFFPFGFCFFQNTKQINRQTWEEDNNSNHCYLKCCCL